MLGFVYVCSAISVIWIEFVREVRWCWEESQPLPLMPAIGSIDLSTCVINQKLHMVSIHNAQEYGGIHFDALVENWGRKVLFFGQWVKKF